MRIDTDPHYAFSFNAPPLATDRAPALNEKRVLESPSHRPQPIDRADSFEPDHDRGPIPFARYLHKLNLESARTSRAPISTDSAVNMTQVGPSKSAPTMPLHLVKPINRTPPARFELVYIPVPIPVTGRLIDVLV